MPLLNGRVCCVCKEWKPSSEFHRHAQHRDGLRSNCKDCRKQSSEYRETAAAESRRRGATFPARHPERATERPCVVCGASFLPRRCGGNVQRFCSKRCQVSDMNRKRRIRCPHRVRDGLRRLADRRRTQWTAYLSSLSCAHCGFADYRALEHHHIDRNTKDFNVGGTWRKWPWHKVMAEAKKCIVLCANCHRILEHSHRAKTRKRVAA